MIYPEAIWRPISKPRGFLHPNIICIHTMVGSLAGTDAHFRSQGTDSHFGVGNDSDGSHDGEVWQWVDTEDIAYANLDGNPEVIAIETSDGGNPNNPWSDKALGSIIKVTAWNCKNHNIPPKLINGNMPGVRGLAYHRQGCDHSQWYEPEGWPYDQWRVRGGVHWSRSLGKTCPGDVRIKQWVDEVIPEVQSLVEGGEEEVADPTIPRPGWMTDAVLSRLAEYNIIPRSEETEDMWRMLAFLDRGLRRVDNDDGSAEQLRRRLRYATR